MISLDTSLIDSIVDLLGRIPNNDMDAIDLVDQAMYQMSLVLQYRQLDTNELSIKIFINKFTHDQIALQLYGEYIADSNILEVLRRSMERESAELNYFERVIEYLEQVTSTPAIRRFTTLVQKFSDIVSYSESKLIKLLNKSINTELRQFPNLQLDLEEADILVDTTTIKDLIHAMKLPPAVASDNSYRGFNQHPGLQTNDDNFKRLFYIFLQIINFHYGPNATDRDYFGIIALMLSVYKNQCHIDWMEINSPELLQRKDQLFKDFFLTWSEQIRRVCYDMINNFNFIDNDMHPQPILFNESTNRTRMRNGSEQPFTLSLEDKQTLLHNLTNITPQLSDFTFEFDPLFLKTLTIYIDLIHEDISIKQDLDYLNDLIMLVNTLVEFENDERPNDGNEIYKTAFSLFLLHKLLSLDNSNTDNQTLLMRYCVNCTRKNYFLLKEILSLWNIKVLSLQQHMLNLNMWNDYSSKFLTSVVFKIWNQDCNKYRRLYFAAQTYHHKKTMAKILLSCWIPKTRKQMNLINLGQISAKKKYFSRWLLRKDNHTSISQQALSFHSCIVLKRFWRVWKSNSDVINDLVQKADLFNAQSNNTKNYITISFMFRQWNTLAFKNDTLLKLKTLTIQEQSFHLRRYFHIMRQRYIYHIREHQFQKYSQNQLIRCYFHKWAGYSRIYSAGTLFKDVLNTKIKRNLILNWQHKTHCSKLAGDFHKIKIIPKYFRNWQLNLKLRHRSTVLPKTYFDIWRLNYLQKQWTKLFNFRITRSLFSKFAKTMTLHRQQLQISIQKAHENVLKHHLNLWFNQSQFYKTLDDVSDTFFTTFYFNKMTRKLETCRELQSIEQQFKTSCSFVDRISKTTTIRLWIHQRDIRFQKANESKVIYFRKTIMDPNIERKVFVHWVLEFNEFRVRQLLMNLKCQQFSLRCLTKRQIFKLWIKRSVAVSQMYKTSETFEQQVLYKKYMVIWYDKFVKKSQQLDMICQELVDQRELKLQYEILSEWSMKYIKVISRHHQSCELFVKRWESSRMKSLFALWYYKLRLKRNSEPSIFYHTSSDLIFDESPLALKSKTKDMDDIDNTETYLSSPVKPQLVPQSMPQLLPNTPMINSNISPTRIQTSIRMKNEKIQALKQHYGKVKPQLKSKIKSVPLFNTALSPPLRPDFIAVQEPKIELPKPPSPIPPAPLLVSRSRSLFSYLSDSIGKNEIDTAKKLRRITPIFIPEVADSESKVSPRYTFRKRFDSHH